MGLELVARRVRLDITYHEIERAIGYREAKYDERARDVYLSQRHADENAENIPRDIRARAAATLRPFIGWDGEGYSTPDGKHHYMLFGASTGDFVSGASLGTTTCFDLLLRVEEQHPDSFHVIFAGNYDVNMMLRDVSRETLHRLKTTGVARWRGYRLEYFKGKWFRLSRNGVTVTLYDVFTFFAKSFVKALEEYIGEDNEDVARIRSGKEKRDAFTYDDIDTVTRYWATELQYLVRLCNALRDYLTAAGLRITRWHGPGAVASAVLRKHRFKRIQTPDSVGVGAQHAYYGGRFEALKIGYHEGTVYQYDIRSAYPDAIAELPDLQSGVWRFHDVYSGEPIRDFALYYVRIRESVPCSFTGMAPFPFRAPNGAVFYPAVSHGGTWVWGVELRAALDTPWADLIDIDRAMVYDDDGSRPFAWIADMYDTRAEWKKAGNPAQLALKLAMNSVYGKLAQQLGAEYKDGSWKIPTFHQLEYAGFITARTRGLILTASHLAPKDVIAVETDAVFSLSPLPLAIGKSLGQWEASTYSGVCYLQSGLYFVRDLDGEWKAKSRGFTRNRLDPSRVFNWLDNLSGYDSVSNPFVVRERRFRTLGTSLGKPDWRRWVDEPREIRVGVPGGKREHIAQFCATCRSGRTRYGDALHDTVPALSRADAPSTRLDYTIESKRYPLIWQGDPPGEYVSPYGDDVTEEEVYG